MLTGGKLERIRTLIVVEMQIWCQDGPWLGGVESLLVGNLILAEQSPGEQLGTEQRDRLI